MTTIAFPTLGRTGPGQLVWTLRANTQAFVSPLDGSVQAQALPGARWAFSADWQNLDEADAGLMRAFLAALAGQANDFTVHNWDHPQPRGSIALSGVTLTSGVSALAESVNLSGCGASATLLPGDFIGFGGELHVVTGSATLTASGGGAITSVPIAPPVRTAQLAGASVTTYKPTARFFLDSPEVSWVPIAGRVRSFSLSASERF